METLEPLFLHDTFCMNRQRKGIVWSLAISAAFSLLWIGYLLHAHNIIAIPDYQSWRATLEYGSELLTPVSDHGDLLMAARTYVISLPRRQDRMQQMEILREFLGLRWTYIEGVDSIDNVVNRTLDNVWEYRARVTQGLPQEADDGQITVPFEWPVDINKQVVSDSALDSFETYSWPWTSTYATRTNMTCAHDDFTIVQLSSDLPEFDYLTPARIACWISHLEVIRRIANGPDEIGLILEDDVNIEKDIQGRLSGILEFLPAGWDMLFLGHCWSDEAIYPSVPGFPTLHPSNSPKCTHAYALSRTGARRLLLHLVYPPFAYSRAIDQAISWLILSKRIKSFSVTPSVIVQRKADASDIQIDGGNVWKDSLVDGVF